MAPEPPQYPKAVQFAIVCGLALIVFGIYKILGLFVNTLWWAAIQSGISTYLSIAWPIVLIGVGILFVWAAKTGRFKRVLFDFNKPFRRSLNDKRLSGLCGGIAEYFAINPTLVRVATVVLFVLSPIFTLVVYVIGSIFVPR